MSKLVECEWIYTTAVFQSTGFTSNYFPRANDKTMMDKLQCTKDNSNFHDGQLKQYKLENFTFIT